MLINKLSIMKKLLFPFLALSLVTPVLAEELDNWDGVDIIPEFYAHKMSHDGVQIVGESADGATVYYNDVTGEAYYYANCSYGLGTPIADNGWVVGSELLDSDSQTNKAVIMANGKITSPDLFKNYVTSNIHSITPDGSRVCGVIGTGEGPTNLPFYCDIDENGNFGELKLLPTPEKDFFNTRPQYCTATWISQDGKTIAGQVLVSSGFFSYPVLYRENEEGIWSMSFPSESLFNPRNMPIPQPIGDFEEEYPGITYPEPTDFMNEEQLEAWNEAYHIWETNNFAEEFSPYNNIDDFLTSEEVQKYNEQLVEYESATIEYSERWENYNQEMLDLADSSVLFGRNMMALSADGKWLASSGEVPGTDIPAGEEMAYYYVPYRFNLETGEIDKIGIDNMDLITNQVFADGSVLCATPAAAILPPSSYIYQQSKAEMISILDYMYEVNSKFANWMETYLSGEIQVGENSYQKATITGLVSASEDLSSICGGVVFSALGGEMYFITYLMTDLEAGVEELTADPSFKGVYTVYNLNGVKVLETRDASSLKNLEKGIYIINGKKVVL